MLIRTLIAAASLAATAAAAQENPVSADALKAALGDAAQPTGAALVLPIEALASPALATSIPPVALDPESGVAMEGYDPVGYFKNDRAIPGSPEFTAEYRGATFRFVSAENRDLFIENPERFTPAYGGYCTETLAAGAVTPGNPTHWTIHGDRLYFTRSAGSTKAFREHRARSVEAANAYWEGSPLASADTYNIRAHQ